MLHSFFYPETEKAFRAVADADPSCAMGYWGIAISQRPNPLTAPFPAATCFNRDGTPFDRHERPRAGTERERDWIEALAPFFQSHDTSISRHAHGDTKRRWPGCTRRIRPTAKLRCSTRSRCSKLST